MRVGIIGGGLMGVALAYFVSRFFKQVTILEQSSTVGGLSARVQLSDRLWIPRYPNTVLPYDEAIRSVCVELDLEDDLVFQPARSGFIHGGRIHNMSTLWDFLSFSPLTLSDRMRLGNVILQARLLDDWRSLDHVPVKEWLIQACGQRTFEQIWAPLLESKFEYDYEQIPATYILFWLNRMSAVRRGPRLRGHVGRFEHGQDSFVQAMLRAVEGAGGRILSGTRVREIETFGGRLGRVRTNNGIMEFDTVIAALPTPEFLHLLLGADEQYRETLTQSYYLGLVCPALVLERPLSPYWTLNIADPTSPFSTIIQIPHPQNPRYHIVYLPKYTAPENDWMGVSDGEIREAWMLRLRQIFSDLKPEEILHFVVSRSRHVEPVHLLNAADHLLPIETPYTGLYLANTAQVYPHLPTSDAAISHARRVAHQIIEYTQQPMQPVV